MALPEVFMKDVGGEMGNVLSLMDQRAGEQRLRRDVSNFAGVAIEMDGFVYSTRTSTAMDQERAW